MTELSKVASRIRQPEEAPVPVITLSGAESGLCSGDGWKLARFEDGQLVGCFDPAGLPPVPDPLEAAQSAWKTAARWMNDSNGEKWLVRCSGRELCEPSAVELYDLHSLAAMANRFAEQLDLLRLLARR